MFFIALAMFYKIFTNYLIKIGGNSRFAILLIFYIPCIIIDVINYISEQLKITPNVTYILLVIEIILIICLIFIPRIFNYNITGIPLLKYKHYLDSKKVLSIANELPLYEDNEFKTNYSISLWTYINTPEINDTLFSIFCYGNESNAKPMIKYGYDIDEKNHMYYIYMNKSMFKIMLPNQRWNNFVFNYNGTNADLFINGILERSIDLTNNMPTYDIGDNITIGSDSLGVSGSITNIYYYPENLSQFDILGMYRLGINIIDL
jgi:hypothetical protein